VVAASVAPMPPPVHETYGEADCAHALEILSYFQMLPHQPDLGRALCLPGLPKQEPAHQYEAHPVRGAPDRGAAGLYGEYTEELSSTYTTRAGQPVQENVFLGLPVEWPKSLTVHVPTLDGSLHSCSPSRHWRAPRGPRSDVLGAARVRSAPDVH